jgi:hypothetical protein
MRSSPAGYLSLSGSLEAGFAGCASDGARVAHTIPLMLGPSRPLPRVGTHARITHFGGYAEAGTVVAVSEGGRRLRVRAHSGESLEFVLSPATARFVAPAHGPRLELLDSGA